MNTASPTGRIHPPGPALQAVSICTGEDVAIRRVLTFTQRCPAAANGSGTMDALIAALFNLDKTDAESL